MTDIISRDEFDYTLDELTDKLSSMAKRLRALETLGYIKLGGGGGGAPANALYLVLATHAALTNERVFVDGDGIVGVDAGAGGNYTLALDLSVDLLANLLGIVAGELDLDSQLANLAFLAPNGVPGKPFFRALAEADIPAAFLTETEGDARYWRYDRIIRTDGAGVWITYDSDGAGLAAAIAAVSAHETLWLPAGTYTGNHTLPANVTVHGLSQADTILSGQIIVCDGTRVENLSVTRTANDATALVGVYAPTSGTAYFHNVKISVTQTGGGTGVGILTSSRGGDLELHGGEAYGSTQDIG